MTDIEYLISKVNADVANIDQTNYQRLCEVIFAAENITVDAVNDKITAKLPEG